MPMCPRCYKVGKHTEMVRVVRGLRCPMCAHFVEQKETPNSKEVEYGKDSSSHR